MKKKSDVSEKEIVNFVARYMHDAGCTTKVVEDKKGKMKRGEGKHRFNKNRIDY